MALFKGGVSRVKLLFYSLLFLTFLLSFFAFENIGENEEIICDSSFIIYKDDVKVELFIKYYIFHDSGFVDLNGTMFMSDKLIQDISFKVIFDYIRKGNSFHLHSKKIESSLIKSQESNLIEDYLPLFYLVKDTDWSIEILKQEPNYFVFQSGSTPSFVCFSG